MHDPDRRWFERPRGSTGVQPLGTQQTRKLLVGIALVVVVVSMVVGLVIGDNAQAVTDRFTLFGGMLTVPITPLHLAAYGGVVSAGVLSIVYLLVRLVSTRDVQAKL